MDMQIPYVHVLSRSAVHIRLLVTVCHETMAWNSIGTFMAISHASSSCGVFLCFSLPGSSSWLTLFLHLALHFRAFLRFPPISRKYCHCQYHQHAKGIEIHKGNGGRCHRKGSPELGRLLGRNHTVHGPRRQETKHTSRTV